MWGLILATALLTLPPTEAPRAHRPRTEAQRVTLLSTEPELCYSGRRFGGKTWIGCLKAVAYALRYPGAKVAICREERASMESTTVPVLRDEILEAAIWSACWKESKSTLFLPNESTVHLFGLDRPERALGARYGLVVIDQAEQLSYAQFEIVNSCVMQPGMPWHQTLLLFNPEDPDHWAYQRYRPDDGDGLREDDDRTVFARVVHVGPEDLLEFLSVQSRERFDRMQGVWKQRLRLGLWRSFEGIVFDLWDPAVHIRKDRPLETRDWAGYPPPEWPRYRAIDFGYEHPWTCQWWTEYPDGRRALYRQTYMTHRTPSQQATEILALEREELDVLKRLARDRKVRGLEPYLEALNLVDSISDHARGERATYEELGVFTTPADKDVLAGIQTVLELMDASEGPPRLELWPGTLVERDHRLAQQQQDRPPTCLEEEIGRYRWRTKRHGEASGGVARQLPIDRHNHGCDAMRYLHHSLAVAPQARIFA